jgi:hypothetical protein
MTHDTYKEWIILSILGELGDEDRRSLETHLAECAGCRGEFENATSFMAVVGEARGTGPTDEMLRDARRSLRDALAKAQAPRVWAGSRVWTGGLRPFRVAFVGAAAVAIGFLAGFLVFGRVEKGVLTPPPVNLSQPDQELGTPVYRNVRLATVDPRSSMIELEYEMIRPARLKAPIDDERILRVLAQAVVNDDNPGARLRAINTIGTYAGQPRDDEIKRALIRAVKTDPNAGVRKQALFVLYRMPFDGDIKEACLDVLANDDNEGLRIAAINMLAVAVLEGNLEGKEIADAVGARLQKDENDYIRIRSEAFLQEVNGNAQ